MKFKKLAHVPKDIYELCRVLTDKGYQAYVVGGAVRDLLIGRKPKDFDIATDARPEETTRVYQDAGYKTFPMGQMGTINVYLPDGEQYEVTTFRGTQTPEEFRKYGEANFSDKVEEDLSRRDLTVNAMALDVQTGELVDPYGGLEDLKNGTVKGVGDANDRFSEDPIRMLRAIRFTTKYGWKMDEETKGAIEKNASKINDMALERIQKELEQILLSEKPSIGLRLMSETGLMEELIPEVEDLKHTPQVSPWHHRDNVFDHTMDVVDATHPATLTNRMAALLHDLGKKDAISYEYDPKDPKKITRTKFIGHFVQSAEKVDTILQRLGYTKKFTKLVKTLVYEHQYESEKPLKMKKLMRRLGADNWADYESLRIGDISVHHPDKVESGMEKWARQRAMYDAIVKNKEPYDIPHLAVGGDDLKELGYTPQTLYKDYLEKVLEVVLDHPEHNTKEFLTKWLANNKKRLTQEVKVEAEKKKAAKEAAKGKK